MDRLSGRDRNRPAARPHGRSGSPSWRASMSRNSVAWPLPGRLHAEAEHDPPRLGEGDVRPFERHPAGVLQEHGNADAAQLPIRRRGAPSLAQRRRSRKARARDREWLRTRRCRSSVPTAVACGMALRPDEVASPERHRVDAGLACGGLDQPLHDVVRFRPPRAAIGPGRHGVGEDAAHADGDLRDVVDGREAAPEIVGGDMDAQAG